MSQMTGIERYKLVYYEAAVEKRWKVTKVTPDFDIFTVLHHV